MNEPNFYLSRGEIGTLIYALDQCAATSRNLIERARKNNMRHLPGVAAGYAMAAAEAETLRERLTRYAVDQGWITLKPEAVQ